MFVFEIRGVITLSAVLLCWSLAVVLFRVSVSGSVARKLSVLLFFEGLTLGTSSGIYYIFAAGQGILEPYPWLEMSMSIAHSFGDCAMIALYPPFLAVALQTRLTRPFARTGVQRFVVGYAVLLFLLVAIGPEQISWTLLYLSMTGLFAFALIAAIHAWLSAQGQARSQALIFVLAFGFRDICWGFLYLAVIRLVWEVELGFPEFVLDIIYPLGTLIAIPLIAYGILRTQLFDIDLRIQWAIKQSTVAGIFVALIFLVSEGASTFLSAELGNVVGLLAAAVVMFFLAPLQQFAELVASAAMPNTKNTTEYAVFRKLQVYESAVSEALLESGISSRERTLLGHLRESLGISEVDAEAIERELG